MMLKAVLIFLCLVIQAQPQTPESDDFSGEIDYAGFGTEKPTASYEDMDDLVSPPFISNETVPIVYEEADNTTYDTTTEPMFTTTEEEETTLTTKVPVYTITTADTTEAYPTTTPLDTTTEPITTAAPTTLTTIITTTHAPTTERPTTKVPTTTTRLPITTARLTTKKFTTTTKGTKAPTTHLTKPFLTTTSRPVTTTTQAPFEFPDPKAPQCSFTDADFFCEEPIVCFGEGEIDCTETFEEILPEATITISKSTSESDSSDFSDDEEAEAETIEYPPELVGRVSPKQRPFLFKMQEFDTTLPSVSSDSDDKDDSSSNTKTTIHITIANGEAVSDSSTSKEVLSLPSDESTTSSISSMATQTQIIIRTESSSDSDKSEFDTKPIAGTTEITPISNFFTEAEGNNVLTTTPRPGQNNSEVTLESAVLVNVTEPEEFSAAFIDDSSDISPLKAHLINKRSENKILSSGSESSSSSMSVSLRVAALESPNQKIRVGRCRIAGTMYCTPSPTVRNCRGRTLCQVVSSTAETSEKSTSAKGVENWAIAVIAICAIAAALTVSLLIYLVFTSWKKLKVQPHSGVTTLNYVNSTPP